MRNNLRVLVAVLALLPSVAAAQIRGETRQIETSFIWSQTEAETKCREVADEARGRWTGQWRISEPGRTSICEVADILPPRERSAPEPRRRDVEAGPIWNQADAEVKCPRIAAEARGRWTGQWRTTEVGRMSVCQIAEERRGRDVDAGPIWSQADAELKCPVAAYAVRGSWTGQWRTTVQGKMSVCEIVD